MVSEGTRGSFLGWWFWPGTCVLGSSALNQSTAQQLAWLSHKVQVFVGKTVKTLDTWMMHCNMRVDLAETFTIMEQINFDIMRAAIYQIHGLEFGGGCCHFAGGLHRRHWGSIQIDSCSPIFSCSRGAQSHNGSSHLESRPGDVSGSKVVPITIWGSDDLQ